MKSLLIMIGTIAVAAIVYFGYRSYYLANSGTSSSTSSTVSTTPVEIKNMAFSPASISVRAGQTVVFTNNDSVGHTVTADDGSFDSGTLAPGATYSHAFGSAGTVSYHCAIHPAMTAKVAVQ